MISPKLLPWLGVGIVGACCALVDLPMVRAPGCLRHRATMRLSRMTMAGVARHEPDAIAD